MSGRDLSYGSLIGHLNHHNVKQWLLKGCDEEDANTIREAVRNTSSYELRKGLARILSGERS